MTLLLKAMRNGVLGFILGAAVALLALVAIRQRAIQGIEYEFNPQFDRYVFAGPEFPHADFEMNRTVHRLLLPTSLTTAYYDAAYHEVPRADQPGRYGAVVTMKIAGIDVLHRFVTLYCAPVKIPWTAAKWPTPEELGIKAEVVRNQDSEFRKMLRRGFAGNGDAAANWAILLAGLSEMAPGDPPAVERTGVVARDEAWWYGLRERIGLALRYPIQVYLPQGYDTDPAKHWPLVYYLTTGAENGTDLVRVRQSSLGLVLERGKQIPAVVIAPQCPLGDDWSVPALAAQLDEVMAKYRIDPDRVSLTGGGETWALALAYPERFSAIVPIDGETDPADAARLKDVPVWAFHGSGDVVTPPASTSDMLAAIRQAGGHTHLTTTTGDGDIWDEVYATEAIYPWILAQKRGQPEVVTAGAPGP
jgi:pimeloyl-ACP methyl ester carboxylesterase